MRIAFIYPQFTGPYGGERHLINLAKGLAKVGDKIEVYTNSITKELKNELHGVKVVENTGHKSKNHNLSTILALIAMPKIVNNIKTKPDILVAMGWQSAFGGLLFKLNNKSIKTIYYCLEPPRFAYDLFNENRLIKKIILLPLVILIRLIDKLSVQSFDQIISNSDWTQKQVKNIYNKNSTVIYPGIEVDRFNRITKLEARNKLSLDKSRTIYLSVSKLHKRKQLDRAIDLFQKEKSKDPSFYIIGTGPYEGELKALIAEKNVKNVFLMGQIPDEKVTLFMKSADYFIFTALNEPYGIAPLEAKVAGAKVLPEEPTNQIYNWTETIKNIKNIFEGDLKNKLLS